MKNKFELHSIVIDHNEFTYFFKREKNDVNGNPRYRVYIIDPDGPAVYETLLKCYDFQIADRVKNYILENIGIAMPF